MNSGYNQGHVFSNPFGNAPQNPQSGMSVMNQGGYTGFQSFVPPPQVPTPKKHGQIRQSKIFPSADKNPNKRAFKGKYELNATIPIKYNTVDYFMLVENVRINNENALREFKRGKAADILDMVLDSLEFISYIHK